MSDQPRFTYDELVARGGKMRIQIRANGRVAVTLSGKEAERFDRQIASCSEIEAQLVMARFTGQFKFGNERVARHKQQGRSSGG